MPLSKDFYYTKKEKETPFETFLRCSNQKENSSVVVARILKNNSSRKNVKFLDIGTGNGEYLRMILDKINPKARIDFTLIEPSNDLIGQLRKTINFFPRNSTTKIIKKTWEEFEGFERFDIILASHLYHIPKEEYKIQLLKMINYLKTKGLLIFILRQEDDVYYFKMKFKPLFLGEKYQPLILNEALEIFKKLSEKEALLKIKIFDSKAKLRIPIKNNFNDTITIIEFFLNKKWGKISGQIQKEIISFINKKRGIFEQIDGIALIRKLE